MQTAYKELNYLKGSLPVCEKIQEEILSLPIGPHMDSAQITSVVESVKISCK
jgi:dTDP-4-amino-4,6-dideoxygalactose transaminase